MGLVALWAFNAKNNLNNAKKVSRLVVPITPPKIPSM